MLLLALAAKLTDVLRDEVALVLLLALATKLTAVEVAADADVVDTEAAPTVTDVASVAAALHGA